MTIDELKAEVFRLAPEGRTDLARELLASLDALSDSEIERLWLDEAERAWRSSSVARLQLILPT